MLLKGAYCVGEHFVDPQCLHGVLCSVPFNLIIGTMTTFRKKVLTFRSNMRVKGVCKEWICACMVLYVQIHLIWYATWLLSVEKMFDHLIQPQGSRVCVYGQNMCLHCALCLIPFNLICNMATFRKKVLTFRSNIRVMGVCREWICACMVLYVSFHLIWYVTWLLSVEKNVWPFDQTTGVEGVCVGTEYVLALCYVLYEYVLAWCSMFNSI